MVTAKENTKLRKVLKLLLLLYFSFFPFGQIFRFQIYSFIVHPTDLLIGLILLLWLTTNFQLGRFVNSPLAKKLVSYVGICFFSLVLGVLNVDSGTALDGTAYFLRFLSIVIFYFFLSDFVQLIGSKEFLKKGLIISGGAIAFFGLIQYFVFPDLRILNEYGWDEHYFRLVGTFLDPGFAGILLVLFTLLTLDKAKKESLTYGLLGVLGTIGVALTFSRASYLALGAGILTLIFVNRKPWSILFLLIFMITVWVTPKPGGEGVNLARVSTLNARGENYEQGVGLFLKNPAFGVGFNLLKYYNTRGESHSSRGLDSSFLFIGATTGVAGLSAFLYFLVATVRARLKSVGIFLPSLIAVLVHSFFQNTLFYPWVLAWLFVLLATETKGNRSHG